ncbi:hypothetical protein EPUL_006332, partial [Erysiphe pulchra]
SNPQEWRRLPRQNRARADGALRRVPVAPHCAEVRCRSCLGPGNHRQGHDRNHEDFQRTDEDRGLFRGVLERLEKSFDQPRPERKHHLPASSRARRQAPDLSDRHSGPRDRCRSRKSCREVCAGIDVNAGCPKPFSTTGGMGAALLKHQRSCAQSSAHCLLSANSAPQVSPVLPFTVETNAHATARTSNQSPTEDGRRHLPRSRCRMLDERRCHFARRGYKLVEEYGVDGAMIATAAETNPSCFRAEADGGIASWEEAVKEYVKISMEVENRWSNTKYLLGQMIPGKQPAYKAMTRTKSYGELVEALGWGKEP